MSRADDLAATDKTVQDFVIGGEISDAEIIDGATQGRKWLGLRGLRLGFSCNIAPSGYVAFPVWLGGFTIQWGSFSNGAVSTGNYAFPVEFTSAAFSASLTRGGGTGDLCEIVSMTKSGINWKLSDFTNGVTANYPIYVLVIGK